MIAIPWLVCIPCLHKAAVVHSLKIGLMTHLEISAQEYNAHGIAEDNSITRVFSGGVLWHATFITFISTLSI